MLSKFITIVVLCFMPLLLLAEVNNISISGEVVNAKDQQVQVILYSFVPGEEDHASATRLDDKNSFQFVAYIREPVIGRIIYGQESASIFIEPGAQLQISFDANNFSKTLQFTGEGATDNNFLSRHAFQYDLSTQALLEQTKKLSAAEFIAWARQDRDQKLNILHAQKDELSPAFVIYQQAHLEYEWANTLFAYGLHVQGAKGKKNKLPEDYFSFIDEVKLHNYDVISLKSYRDFLSNYIQHLYNQTYQLNAETDKEYYNHLYALAADNLRSLPKYHIQAVYLVEAITYLGLDIVKDEYIEFANECPAQPYKNELHELIKMQNVFEVNKPKVVFNAKDGSTIDLQDLKGSIVLVRFDNNVQTADPVQLQAIDAQLKNQLTSFSDVQFLQLSMVDNRDAYERMVYADANDYLKSIINRPKPGQQVELPAWSYVVLNREGLVVSNSLDDPNNELAIEKIKVILQQEDQQVVTEQ